MESIRRPSILFERESRTGALLDCAIAPLEEYVRAADKPCLRSAPNTPGVSLWEIYYLTFCTGNRDMIPYLVTACMLTVLLGRV
jgi:hypothetical protein